MAPRRTHQDPGPARSPVPTPRADKVSFPTTKPSRPRSLPVARTVARARICPCPRRSSARPATLFHPTRLVVAVVSSSMPKFTGRFHLRGLCREDKCQREHASCRLALSPKPSLLACSPLLVCGYAPMTPTSWCLSQYQTRPLAIPTGSNISLLCTYRFNRMFCTMLLSVNLARTWKS
ncbi:hypothetical protein FS749_005491 [Ceratobasidium sp. UAMH 11750]|nr:hypothetical protein FS749_005491 [Ceratobasidium sp. UAMH 11750]